MPKTILITGSTDGIGLATARALVSEGHTVLLHGRNPEKLADTVKALAALPGAGELESYVADLSRMADVEALATAVAARHESLAVLINNAGIYRATDTRTPDGLDLRFAVNTFAPYLLTLRLMPLLGSTGRVVNLSSAAQAPVNLEALAGNAKLKDMDAYAQSKLALTMWSRDLAHQADTPVIIAVNPGSMLGTKMVKEGFGVAGGGIGIGSAILVRAALSDEFAAANGLYFDNDAGQFGDPHPDALAPAKVAAVMQTLAKVLSGLKP